MAWWNTPPRSNGTTRREAREQALAATRGVLNPAYEPDTRQGQRRAYTEARKAEERAAAKQAVADRRRKLAKASRVLPPSFRAPGA